MSILRTVRKLEVLKLFFHAHSVSYFSRTNINYLEGSSQKVQTKVKHFVQTALSILAFCSSYRRRKPQAIIGRNQKTTFSKSKPLVFT